MDSRMNRHYNKKPKKAKINGFSLFAQEFSRQHHLSMAFEDLIKIVNPHWQELSEEKKQFYKNKAKGRENLPIDPNQEQKPKLPMNMKPAELEALIKNEKQESMMEEVRKLVQNAYELGHLHTTVFNIISGSSFFENKVEIYPAEFASSLFCLQEGVFNSFQTSINPGQLPRFTRYDAISRSEKTFKYPVPEENDPANDYIQIFVRFLNYLEPRTMFPKVFFAYGSFIDDEDFTISDRVIRKILEESGEYSIAADLKIYPVHYLLYYLKFFVLKEQGEEDGGFESVKEAYNILKTEEILYEFSTKSCEFHLEADVPNHCCLSKACRSGFVLAKYCVDPKMYDLQEGKHFPLGYSCSK